MIATICIYICSNTIYCQWTRTSATQAIIYIEGSAGGLIKFNSSSALSLAANTDRFIVHPYSAAAAASQLHSTYSPFKLFAVIRTPIPHPRAILNEFLSMEETILIEKSRFDIVSYTLWSWLITVYMYICPIVIIRMTMVVPASQSVFDECLPVCLLAFCKSLRSLPRVMLAREDASAIWRQWKGIRAMWPETARECLQLIPRSVLRRYLSAYIEVRRVCIRIQRQ